VTGAGDRGAIGFAEKVLELLEEGRYTATYKYAVLLALIDLCLELTEASGAPPQMVTTRQLADKIVEIYWPHTLPFAGHSAANGAQAEHDRPGGDRVGHQAVPRAACPGRERPALGIPARGAARL
jgi:hypothetical protein